MQPQAKTTGFAQSKRLGQAKVKEFNILSSFKLGYRNREDNTNTAPGVLISGSQNVLTDVSGRVGIRKGYTLDGAASAVLAPILSAFDWEMHIARTHHLRAGFLTTAGNDGKLQYRYVNPTTGAVTWRDLMSNLTSVSFNFCDYWDSTNSQAYLLFVDGSSNIYEWSGGVTTFASATVNTITKQGTTTFAEEGFYVTGTKTVTINGTDYTATGGWGTTTLTGVTPDPTLAGHAVGSVINQKVITTANSAMTAIPAVLKNDLIANLRNQIYIGSLLNNSIYVSKVNNYKDYSFTAPTRIVGEGALLTLDAPARALIPQEEYMTVFAGHDQAYQTKFTLSADLTKEDLAIARLKTTALQGTQSQALTTKIKNDVAFVSNEPILNTLGRVDNVVLTPQVSDLSYPIVNDMNSYDFTNASIFYHRKYIYMAIPALSIVRIYNMTDDSVDKSGAKIHYWEAPQLLPISRFSAIDGELYGHSYLTSETYKLFTGYNDNNHPIDARAVFSYQNYGVRSADKSFNHFFVEGYISSNATLNGNVNYEIDGVGGNAAFTISGTDTAIVLALPDDASLGKKVLGTASLGADSVVSASTLPPKFRTIKTFPRTPFYEESTSFSSNGVDFNWSILAFGSASTPNSEGNNSITQ